MRLHRYNHPLGVGGGGSTLVYMLTTFFCFIESNKVEERFIVSLSSMLIFNWQGDADWFLSTSYEWSIDLQGYLSVHMCQSVFVNHISEHFFIGNCNKDTLSTPYNYGLLIDCYGIQLRITIMRFHWENIGWYSINSFPPIVSCYFFTLLIFNCKFNIITVNQINYRITS